MGQDEGKAGHKRALCTSKGAAVPSISTEQPICAREGLPPSLHPSGASYELSEPKELPSGPGSRDGCSESTS